MAKWWVKVTLGLFSLVVAFGIWSVKSNFSKRLSECETLGGGPENCSRLVYGTSPWIDAFGPEFSPPLPSDSRTRLLMARSPKSMASYAYCYFQHRGWFAPGEVTPEIFSRSVQGFSILVNELSSWKAAKETPAMIECGRRVAEFLGEKPRGPEDLFQGRDAVVVVNPAALNTFQDPWKTMLREAATVFVHEKIHVFQKMCPEADAAAKLDWQKLSVSAHDEFAKAHPGYAWSNLEVAVREFLAFQYEASPEALLKRFPGCSR